MKTTKNKKNMMKAFIFRPILLLLFMLILLPNHAWSQGGPLTVSGIVKDTKGETIIGVTVAVRNKSLGTITDLNGRFELKGVTPNDVLLFTYIGMENKAMQVVDNTPLNIVLTEGAHELEEVVAIGYGSVKKRDLTGAMKSVSNDNFKDQALSTAEEALKGRVAGALVSADNSPGGGISIQIRGSNSMLGGTEPLYVIDGFPVEPNADAKGSSTTASSQSSLNFLNPNDIESLEVLKDASATAIYGARGANGVVLITTKSGKSGVTQVTYSAKYGVSELSKKIEVLNAEEYANYRNQTTLSRYYVQDAASKYGSSLWNPAISVANPALGYAAIGNYPWDLGAGTNWQDAIYHKAMSKNHSVLIQGGTGDTKMSLSLGYTQQDGILINSSYERFTINGSIEHPINKHLKVLNKLNLSRGTAKASNVGGDNVGSDQSIVTAALWTLPTYQLLKEVDLTNPANMLVSVGSTTTMTNPYLMATQLKDDKLSYTLQNNLSLEYKLGTEFLATGSIGLSHNTNERAQYWPSFTSRGLARQGQANKGINDMTKLLSEARVNYTKKIGSNHSLGAMLAYTFEQTDYKDSYQEYYGLNDAQSYFNVSQARSLGQPQDSYWMSRLMSGISRVNYSFKERYLFTGSFRADASSRAAENKKLQYFPSLALAWRLSEEPFMSKLSWLNNAKIRTSYGVTGNYPNTPYMSLPTLDASNTAFNGGLQSSVYQSIAPTPNLSWERTDQYNAGADFAFFNSYLKLTVDIYLKRTHDLLQNVNVAPNTGFSYVLMNLGEVENKGFEFDVTGTIFRQSKTSLTVSFNGAINRNKLLSLGASRDYVTGSNVAGFNGVNRFIVGQPLGVFWGYKQEGILKNWDEVMNSAQKDATPGDNKLENIAVDYDKNLDGTYKLDANGNKIASANQVINELDKTIIGNPNPDFTFGFTLNYTLGKFDANVLLTGQLGGSIFWADYTKLSGAGSTSNNILKSVYDNMWSGNYTQTITDANAKTYTFGNSTANTDGALYPRLYDTNTEPFSTGYSVGRKTYHDMNSAYLFDASYLKIQNVSVGYTFVKLNIIQSLRLSVSATNLFTFSKYPGYDPTIVSSSSPMRRGIDLGGYPAQRNYSVNLVAKF